MNELPTAGRSETQQPEERYGLPENQRAGL